MLLPSPRGPVSAGLFERLRTGSWPTSAGPGWCPDLPALAVLDDEDVQICLWVMYELHYRSFDDVDEACEWAPDVLETRRTLESAFEGALRDLTREQVSVVAGVEEDLAERLFDLCASFEGPALASYVQRKATRDQVREVLLHRSILQLKEADPYSWAIPRLAGAAKATLVELQFDEYGDGVAARVHQDLYAAALRCGELDPAYGAYVEQVPGTTLAMSNAVSLFGLHRRLRGAAMGHLGAFEATSAVPSRQYADAIRRLDIGEQAAFYFDEHVEADAVHEQLALRGVCATMATEDPSLETDIVFGACTCLALDARWAGQLLDAWGAGRHLVEPPPEHFGAMA